MFCYIASATLSETEQSCVKQCPQPCRQVVYEPSLSYASLSFLNLDQLFKEGKDKLQHKYQKSLNNRYRTVPEYFVKDVAQLHDITDRLMQFLTVITRKLSPYDSPFKDIETVAFNFITNSIKQDLATLTSDVKMYEENYNDLYGKDLRVLNRAHHDIQDQFEKIEQLVSMSKINGELLIGFADNVKLAWNAVLFIDESAQFLFQKLTNKTFAIEFSNVSKTGAHDLPNELSLDQCFTHFKAVKIYADELNQTFYELSQTNLSLNVILNISSRNNPKPFLNSVSQAVTCSNEFLEKSKAILEYKAETDKKMDKLNANQYVGEQLTDFQKHLGPVRMSLQILGGQIQGYGSAAYSKLRTYQLFKESQTSLIKFMQDLRDNLKIRFIPRLTVAIQDTCKLTSNTYLDSLYKISDYYDYFNEIYKRHKISLLKIFKRPIPNMEHPGMALDAGRELWRTWKPSKGFEEFLESDAEGELDATVNSFCNELLMQVHQHQNALVDDVDGLVAALENALEVHKVTAQESTLNSDFIM